MNTFFFHCIARMVGLFLPVIRDKNPRLAFAATMIFEGMGWKKSIFPTYHLEDHPRYRKWLGSPPKNAIWKGNNPT